MAGYSDLNHIVVTGRLGRAPQLTQSGSGNAYCRFSLAHNRLSDYGSLQVFWFNVTIWGDLAAPMARRLSKGDFVTVVGRIETRYDATNSTGYLDIIAEDVVKSVPGSAIGGNQNTATIAGRLGRDAEYRLVGKEQNVPMLTFSIANSRESASGFERTSWLNLVVWGELATEYRSLKLSKGQHVTVKGYLEASKRGEGDERRTFYQVVGQKVSLNDRRGTKRWSGAGNGANEFEHYSQQTVSSDARLTDGWDTDPDVLDSIG
jgi:single-strand DNA-binding protein